MTAIYGWILVACCLSSTLFVGAQVQEQELEGPVAVSAAGHPVVPPPNLAQDLMDIYSLIQFKPMNQLFERYLLNDAQFQAFVRIMNSNAGFMARWRLLSQSEIVLLRQWVNQQIMASQGKFKVKEVELCLNLQNRFPYWSGTVYGWQGFLNELEMYFPQYAIRAQILAKVQQQGIFAQFWTRVQSLQIAYERWLTMPGTQTVLVQLQTAGIDTVYLDTVIRDLFGWTVVNGTTATATPATAVVVNSQIL